MFFCSAPKARHNTRSVLVTPLLWSLGNGGGLCHGFFASRYSWSMQPSTVREVRWMLPWVGRMPIRAKTFVKRGRSSFFVFFFLHISQDPNNGTGHKSSNFVRWITEHFIAYEREGRGYQPAQLFETKWSAIKHDVAKFVGTYRSVYNLNESSTMAESWRSSMRIGAIEIEECQGSRIWIQLRLEDLQKCAV